MRKIYDLAIIGTGSVGAAAGYYASQAGLNVLELDAHVPPSWHRLASQRCLYL
ncbi:hypothetical protein [Fructilactobacillus cliffordii]|uniref:FAD dependent oxidoreductase domain-containing protein n=1 Tax=Fructilactobacillus cliffordii TaxID=2940299 RepID=A0A9Q8ZRZ9_9LACO|nr:hypothetical protein [Fructilactobacillus cliffordii]USS88723.1 hypothetical protein M3M40_04280 [Fructilactobacillus cliffordii]